MNHTHASGAVTDSYEYDAFGNSYTTSGSTPNEFLYRGEQYDPDLGLYYLRARYYNPLTGRFMSRDPEAGRRRDPRSLHKYLYAAGDPTNALDPMGREILFGEGAIDRNLILQAGPAIVAGFGFVASQAAEYGVAASLAALDAATTAAEALGDFLAAVDYAAAAQSVAKLFLCVGVELGLGELIDKFAGDHFSDFIPDEVVDKFREACLGFLAPY